MTTNWFIQPGASWETIKRARAQRKRKVKLMPLLPQEIADDPRGHQLMDIALLMAQELQEFVDEACEASGDDNALPSVQALLADWERAYVGN